ncbi:hypothetical protein [Larkinella terrae]|uniref:Tetratricopeptide repeat protein n=1 Tax=Larkinella terrae TaxID=2025311 RepID=A0A7K0EUS5_9BACT|nr:hypothetical protein [Larkinella terrae]MRS65306.1 hypothetical protein [Larkinella terrae]
MRPDDQLKQWEWIEDYYQNKLPISERLIFEQELARDAEFRQTAERLKTADQALRFMSLENTVRKAVRQELTHRPLVRRVGLGRMAVSGVVLIGMWLAYLTFDGVDLQTYRDDVTLTQRYRELGEDVEETALTPRQRSFYRNFFDAQAFLANGQPEMAIANLEKLARADSLRPYFRQAVEWHLLNAYLLNNQPNNADSTLRMINESGELVYRIDRTDRWKVWWQIRWQKLTH